MLRTGIDGGFEIGQSAPVACALRPVRHHKAAPKDLPPDFSGNVVFEDCPVMLPCAVDLIQEMSRCTCAEMRLRSHFGGACHSCARHSKRLAQLPIAAPKVDLGTREG